MLIYLIIIRLFGKSFAKITLDFDFSKNFFVCQTYSKKRRVVFGDVNKEFLIVNKSDYFCGGKKRVSNKISDFLFI